MALYEKVMRGDISNFAIQMKKMVNSKENSDIKFMIGPNKQPMYAHRCILASRCAVFKAMFSEQVGNNKHKDKDVPLVLTETSPEVFLAMLEFIYTNCVSMTSKIGLDVLETSIEYGLDELQKLTTDYLIEILNTSNACDIIQAAVKFSNNDLRDESVQFIAAHTMDVFKSKGFQELSPDCLATVLTSDQLCIDELDLYKAVKEWANVNSTIEGKSIKEVGESFVHNLRLPLLTDDELSKLEEENKTDNFIPAECFAFAWKIHALKKGEKGNPLTTKRKGTNHRDIHKYIDNSK
ncbi:hypothetical protein LOTGIDRAFT_225923 [Lottia gigantea]|uniref:BTB domain-containing protein n=1 Tax=Lottia gigantea TaxID=225164 RepID=V4B248_LOTGI|nr:hypothetical protein LOTGIDRAFT_225923 [Lottia gigantea]ESP00327.1 hypothetical protein LOTGIDRAFT_225923 [Lottia gigantea]